MCGILGVRKSWQPDASVVERALESLAWRGPDSLALESVDDWQVGVARLAISDPDASQPLTCPRTGRVVAFNGAVTSAAEERATIPERAQTGNDAELLLLRLEDRGPTRLGDMTGPYAFAIVDPVADEVLLGRDPEGEKPLFLAFEGARLVAFASTLHALRVLGVDVDLAPVERGRLLRFGFFLSDFESDRCRIRELDPGVYRVRAGEAIEHIGSPRHEDPRSLRNALELGVERCATATVPVGLTLSGGIDSACIAACLEGRGLPAYQFCAAGEPGAERERARAAAAHLGHELREVDGDAAILRALPELTRDVGAPLGDPSVLAAHAVARAAAADGVRVMLSGEGADDLLLGYARHRAARWLPRRGRRWLRPPWPFATTRGSRLRRAFRALVPYDALLHVAPPGFLDLVVSDTLEVPETLPATAEQSSLDRARVVDRRDYLRRDLLPKLDVATLAAGVEGRCPFLDPAVLRCDAVLEPNARRVLGKRALRDAFADCLPPGFLDQRKTGFAVPLDRWIREDDFLADVLLDRRTRDRDWIDADGLVHALDLHRRGRIRVGHGLYLIAALELHDRALEEDAR